PGAEAELLVSCECGATGTPAALVWTGHCCGPCHDYEQEHGRPRERRPFVLARHEDGIIGLAFTASGAGLVTAGQDGVVDVGDPWRHEARVATMMLKEQHDWSPVSFACNGEWVALSSQQEDIILLNAETGDRVHAWRLGSGGGCTHLALSADGRRLAGTDGMLLEVFETTGSERPVRLPANDDQFRSLAFSPDGGRLAVVTDREGIGLYGSMIYPGSHVSLVDL